MVSNQSKKLQIICSLVILFTVAVMPLGGASHSPVQADELLRVRAVPTSPEEEYVPDQIIVKFKTGICSATKVDLYKRLGASVFYTSPYAGFEVVQIPEGKTVAEIVEAYSKESIVEYAEPNYIRRACWAPNDPYYPYQWHFDQINVETAWDLDTTAPNYGGDPSIVVAVLDSGVAYENYGIYQKAPDLANTNFVQGWDFVNSDAHPNDDVNHGTHVCGTIAQSTHNTIGVAGIAFNTTIMPIKTLSITGGTHVQMADGFHYAADNGAHIINYSAGGVHSTTKENAVIYARNAGVIIIAAMGNDGDTTNDTSYPAAYNDYVIAVGATRYDETRSYYSSYGSHCDIAAPGGDTRAWVDQNNDGYVDGVLQQTFVSGDPTDFSYYYFFQGTSMATPHVSGVAALILAEHPTWTAAQVRHALLSTATDKGTSGRDDEYGWGLLDAYEALAPTKFTEHTIKGDFGGAMSVYATDVDGDGDVDVLGTATKADAITWWENDGSQNFTEHTIAGSFDYARSVYATDVDSDGDIDVLGAAEVADDITWWENDGSESFTEHTIAGSFAGASSVYATDVDEDGDVDILGAAKDAHDITWWENDGSENFTEHTISGNFTGAISVYATDVDSDGDIDVLGAASSINDVTWWENDGSENFTEHTIKGDFGGAMSVYATDVDGDSDVDILGAAWSGDITWWENDGNENFTEHAISANFTGAKNVYATDVDGDGDIDVLGAA